MKVAEELAANGLVGLPPRAWPSGHLCDEIATAIEKQRRQRVRAPFIYVDLRKYLPEWVQHRKGPTRKMKEKRS